MANKNDEIYTPKILVKPIFEYIPKELKIWFPFDTNSSEFVIYANENEYNLNLSDFIRYIISNFRQKKSG